MNILESNNYNNVDDVVRKLINLTGSTLKDFEQLQKFLQHEKNPLIIFICWLDTGAMALNETLNKHKDDDLLEFDF